MEVDGVDAPLRGVKVARILARLLINANRRVSIDALLDAVWGDQVSEAAEGTLESHIWRLRKLMEPTRRRQQEPTYLVNDSVGYRLTVNPDNADSLRFAQLSEQGDHLLASGDPERALRRYELALDLWRGRPFDVVADEEWAAASIARLEELYGQVNEQRVEALLRTGNADQAVAVLEGLTAELPYRERLWAQLMLGLYQAGRLEEALGAYRRARDTLLDTLGLEPGAALRELQQRILEQDPALEMPAKPAPAAGSLSSAGQTGHPAAPSGAVHLPSRLSTLVGREFELERVTELVNGSRLVTLVGAGGCGKTRLAIDVARSVAAQAPDGVWFVDLAAVADPAAVADTVAATIGLEQPQIGTTLTALGSYLRDHRVLLLVDNCEHLLPAVYQLLDALLDDDSQCRVLATSREPIGLDGEVLWSLAPLAVHQDRHDQMEVASPAAQLFLARARGVDPMFEAAPAAMSEVEAICTAVDGLPLAIELAAGRMRTASLGEVRRQVTDELGDLGRLGYAPTEHHRTVQLSIEWSVRLLSETERVVHARLSALPGSFTIEAARAVAGTTPLRPEDVPGLLTQLVHRSLLAVVPGDRPDSPTRFRQLATVRAHAAHALAESGDAALMHGRRTAFIADLVAARPPDHAADSAGWYSRTRDNHDTLVAVLSYTLHEHPDPIGVRLVGRVSSYWFFQNRIAEGTRWLQAARTQPHVPAQDRAIVELSLATLTALHDRTDLSLQLARDALKRTDPAARDHTFVYLLVAAAWCSWVRGDPGLDIVYDDVAQLAEQDPTIALWAEVMAIRIAFDAQGPVVAARAADLADRAERAGHLSAAWLAGWLVVICALMTTDPAGGQAWLRRTELTFRKLGGGPAANSVEFEANFAALAGAPELAAELFGRASTMAYRAGSLWPISPTTEPVLAQVRQALPPERFDAAWQNGIRNAETVD